MKTEARCSRCDGWRWPHKLIDEDSGRPADLCPGPAVYLDTPYDGVTWRELAYWIDDEGGVAGFFANYMPPGSSSDERLEALHTAFAAAYVDLRAYLQEKGGLL